MKSIADRIEAFAATRKPPGPECRTCRDLSPDHLRAINEAKDRGISSKAIKDWLETEGGYGVGRLSFSSIDNHLREKHKRA